MSEQSLVDKFIRFNPVTKFWEPAWFRREIVPFWLYPDEQYVTGAITINAAGTPTPAVNYKLPHASIDLDAGLGNPLKIEQFVFEDSTDTTTLAAWTVMIEDMGEKVRYMNAPIHVRTLAGGVQTSGGGTIRRMLPAYLFEPLFLPSRHSLMLTFNKLTGGATNVRFFPVGGMFYTWAPTLQKYPLDYRIMVELVNKHLERRKYIKPFYLTTEGGGVTVNANQLAEFDMLIGDDGHFESSHIMSVSTGDYELQFFNPQTRQTMSNGWIHSKMLGDAFNPQPFPASWVIPSGQTVRVRIRDLSGSTNNVYMTLRGRKINAPFRNIAEVARELGIPVPQAEGQRMVPKSDMTALSKQQIPEVQKKAGVK